jgi:hypothetical protein
VLLLPGDVVAAVVVAWSCFRLIWPSYFLGDVVLIGNVLVAWSCCCRDIFVAYLCCCLDTLLLLCGVILLMMLLFIGVGFMLGNIVVA